MSGIILSTWGGEVGGGIPFGEVGIREHLVSQYGSEAIQRLSQGAHVSGVHFREIASPIHSEEMTNIEFQLYTCRNLQAVFIGDSHSVNRLNLIFSQLLNPRIWDFIDARKYPNICRFLREIFSEIIHRGLKGYNNFIDWHIPIVPENITVFLDFLEDVAAENIASDEAAVIEDDLNLFV